MRLKALKFSYALNVHEIISVSVKIKGVSYLLKYIRPEEMDIMLDNSFVKVVGLPSMFTYNRRSMSITFYPLPSKAYNAEVMATRLFSI